MPGRERQIRQAKQAGGEFPPNPEGSQSPAGQNEIFLATPAIHDENPISGIQCRSSLFPTIMVESPTSHSRLTSTQWHAVSASFLGWTLDAFDFFVVVFLVDVLAAQFHVSASKIILTTAATLAMRPLGAFIFGMLADRYGRRTPLMANVVFFSVAELLCGFAPNYTVFLILRTIYGIGMGGEWGVGASLAMESVPTKRRGLISGIVQSGYSCGYLLAAVATKVVLPFWGWRAMFWVGGLPALLAFYIRYRVTESEAWKQQERTEFRSIVRTAASHWKLFAFMVAMMSLMQFLSHGTQDLYPHFLKSAHGFTTSTVANIAIIYNVGSLLGAILFGRLSEWIGRRRALVGAALLALCIIPLWAFGHSLAALAVGAFLMQVGVQGAWGIIPAHLNELSPPAVRGLIPGLAYQFGTLVASPVNMIEYALRDRFGYAWALAGFEIVNIVLLATVVSLGPERSGKDFLTKSTP
jgi:SHS family lactate transporter-like MFS transporter